MPTPTQVAAHPAASNVRAAGADEVCHPCSDGKPMADDMWQGNAIRNAAGDLEAALPDASPLDGEGEAVAQGQHGGIHPRIGPHLRVQRADGAGVFVVGFGVRHAAAPQHVVDAHHSAGAQ